MVHVVATAQRIEIFEELYRGLFYTSPTLEIDVVLECHPFFWSLPCIERRTSTPQKAGTCYY
jgi:hypothetical protein